MKISLKDKALIKELRKDFPEMTEGQRFLIFKAVTKDYCPHCADKHLPCYCDDDE